MIARGLPLLLILLASSASALDTEGMSRIATNFFI
jgi:hypothetical protein